MVLYGDVRYSAGMDAVEQALDVARKDAHMSWAELARRADLDPVTIYRYRKGEVRSADTTYRLEKLLNLPPGHLDGIAASEHGATVRIPTLEELLQMPLADVLRVLDRIEQLNGPAARRQFRDDLVAYMDRRAATERTQAR